MSRLNTLSIHKTVQSHQKAQKPSPRKLKMTEIAGDHLFEAVIHNAPIDDNAKKPFEEFAKILNKSGNCKSWLLLGIISDCLEDVRPQLRSSPDSG